MTTLTRTHTRTDVIDGEEVEKTITEHGKRCSLCGQAYWGDELERLPFHTVLLDAPEEVTLTGQLFHTPRDRLRETVEDITLEPARDPGGMATFLKPTAAGPVLTGIGEDSQMIADPRDFVRYDECDPREAIQHELERLKRETTPFDEESSLEGAARESPAVVQLTGEVPGRRLAVCGHCRDGWFDGGRR